MILDNKTMNTASSGSHTRTSVVKHVEPIPVIGGGARKLLESYLNDVLHNPHTNAIKKRSRKIDSVGLITLLHFKIY